MRGSKFTASPHLNTRIASGARACRGHEGQIVRVVWVGSRRMGGGALEAQQLRLALRAVAAPRTRRQRRREPLVEPRAPGRHGGCLGRAASPDACRLANAGQLIVCQPRSAPNHSMLEAVNTKCLAFTWRQSGPTPPGYALPRPQRPAARLALAVATGPAK